MATPRGQLRLVVVAGAVFGAAGEFIDGRRDTEVYDIERGRWRTLDAILPRPRASFGCVVDEAGAVLAISGGTHTGGVFEFLTDVDALTFGGTNPCSSLLPISGCRQAGSVVNGHLVVRTSG